MNKGQKEKLIGIVSNLENILGMIPPEKTQKAENQTTFASLSEFDSKIAEFVEKSKVLAPQLQSITQYVENQFLDMKNIMEFSSKAKRPSQNQTKELHSALLQKLEYFRSQDRDKDYGFHFKAFFEGQTGITWTLNDTMPKMVLESAIESSEYNANKFKVQKNQEINGWYNAYLQALKVLKSYIETNYPSGLNFNEAQGTNDYSELIQVLQSYAEIKGVQQDISQQAIKIQEIPEEEGYASLDDFKGKVEEFLGFSEQSGNETIQKIPHMKDYVAPIQEGLACVNWVFSPTPKVTVEAAIESFDYYAIKVKRLKIDEHTNWINGFSAVIKEILTYVNSYYRTGLEWNSKKLNQSFAAFLTILKEEPQYQQLEDQQQAFIPPPMSGPGSGGMDGPPSLAMMLEKNPDKVPTLSSGGKYQEPEGEKGALFSQINVGMENIKKHLRHVDKNQRKQEIQTTDKPLEKQVVQKQVQQSKQAVKKLPNKYIKGDNWYIEYFENERIEFTEDELNNPKQCVFIDNCKKTVVKVNPKINTIFANKCDRLEINFHDLIATVELMNCKNVEVIVQQRCPSISIDKCESVHICLMKDRMTEIISSKTAEINVTYFDAEQDNFAKDTPIPEQFVTKYNEETGKFQTIILDGEL